LPDLDATRKEDCERGKSRGAAAPGGSPSAMKHLDHDQYILCGVQYIILGDNYSSCTNVMSSSVLGCD
jgi:hypothetical protein